MNRPTSGRAHLSIGEVLSLLQDEFPDVTISKIRFLESQGLLDPERTPSGYRKFYDVDIQRLRWILRQQKEHYLPLKVIKDRLDRNGGEIPEDEEEETAPVDGVADRETRGKLGVRHLAEGVLGAQGVNGLQLRTTVESLIVTGPPDRWRESPVHDVPLDVDRRRKPRVLPAPPPPPEAPLSGRSALAREGSNGVPSQPGRRKDVPRQAAPRPVTPQDAPRRTTRDPGGTEAGPGEAVPGTSDVRLSIEELAEVSGLAVRELRELEKFGLIERQEGVDAEVYDGDAVVISQTAAGFLEYGIEARHMRAYRVAAEREAGLFEQIVQPVMRQRDPEARVKAGRTVTELMRLGDVMRGVLLRRALRDHLGGGT